MDFQPVTGIFAHMNKLYSIMFALVILLIQSNGVVKAAWGESRVSDISVSMALTDHSKSLEVADDCCTDKQYSSNSGGSMCAPDKALSDRGRCVDHNRSGEKLRRGETNPVFVELINFLLRPPIA